MDLLTLNHIHPASQIIFDGKCLANPTRGVALGGVDQIGDGDCRRHRNVQVNVIRLALRLYDPRILGFGNRSHIGMKTIAPLPIYKGPPFLCTPDEMKIYTEIFSSHARYNWEGDKVVKKFLQKSAAPSALVSRHEPFSRPDGRAYALSALRAWRFGLHARSYNPLWEIGRRKMYKLQARAGKPALTNKFPVANQAGAAV